MNPSEEFDESVSFFDLLLNFQFVFSHLVTFGRRLLDSVLLSDFVLDLFVHAHGFLSWPPLGPPPGPPLKSDPFLVDSLAQDSHFSVRSGPGPFWGLRRPSTVLRM